MPNEKKELQHKMCIRDSHYEDNVSIVEKFDPNKIWTAALYDADPVSYTHLDVYKRQGINCIMLSVL